MYPGAAAERDPDVVWTNSCIKSHAEDRTPECVIRTVLELLGLTRFGMLLGSPISALWLTALIILTGEES